MTTTTTAATMQKTPSIEMSMPRKTTQMTPRPRMRPIESAAY
jgi:hypothetical protein